MADLAPVSEGTVTLSASEQTVFEVQGYELYSIKLEVVGAATGVTYIRTYEKVLAAGAYVLVDTTTVENVPTDPLYKSIFFSATLGLKWTIQTTSGAYYDVDWSVEKAIG
jgi:hypothetical protein